MTRPAAPLLDAVPRSARVRARANALGSDAASDRTARAWLAAHVLALELRGLEDGPTVERLSRHLLVGVVPVLLAVVLVAGPGALVLVLAGIVVADVVARRTTPRRQQAAVERQLPIVLESVARRLRAGGSLAQALADAAPDRPADLCRSWRALVARLPVCGVDASLEEWTTSSPLPSVRLAGAALALAATSGGSPARAIDGVAATLRARLALADEIRALSSQARASALVIAVSPVVFGAAAAATDDRTGAFFRTPLGVALLVAGLSLDLIGWRWMSRLCRAR